MEHPPLAVVDRGEESPDRARLVDRAHAELAATHDLAQIGLEEDVEQVAQRTGGRGGDAELA